MSFLLHAQCILSHRLPPALVASSYVLVQGETLREPEGAVLSLAPGNHDTQDEDDQQEEGPCHQQRQQGHTLLWGLQRLSCGMEAAGEPSAGWEHAGAFQSWAMLGCKQGCSRGAGLQVRFRFSVALTRGVGLAMGQSFGQKVGLCSRGALTISGATCPSPSSPRLTPHIPKRVWEIESLHRRQGSQVVSGALGIREAVVALR